MVLGAALIGYGAHYLTLNGNCSSTGYVSYGPVPTCQGPEALYIVSTFFLGPIAGAVGWGYARIFGVLWPAVCVAVGLGMLTIRLDRTAPPGARTFGLAAGACFFALAVVSVVVTARKRLRKRNAGAPGATAGPSGAGAAGPAGVDTAGSAGADIAGPVTGPPAHTPAAPLAAADTPAAAVPTTSGGAAPDPLDRIAKLAQLRDSGALTEMEFEREKAKLLAEMLTVLVPAY